MKFETIITMLVLSLSVLCICNIVMIKKLQKLHNPGFSFVCKNNDVSTGPMRVVVEWLNNDTIKMEENYFDFEMVFRKDGLIGYKNAHMAGPVDSDSLWTLTTGINLSDKDIENKQ